MRPVIKEDGTGPDSEMVVSSKNVDDCGFLVRVPYKGRQKTFEVDHVFDSACSQDGV